MMARVTSASLRTLCGQLLSVGFDGPQAPAELLDRIARSEVGGVMLFRPNIVEPGQVAELVRTLRRASPAGSRWRFPSTRKADWCSGCASP
jgi:beta-glucosidase-like glycosyl hydrolase